MPRPPDHADAPIGVFDSGLGGLTVVKELLHALPNERVVYFGDTARVPYGTKSKESIIRFATQIVTILLKYKVKMIVVACNTASSLALATIQRKFSVPIVGVIDPGARKAAASTRNRKVGIIATQSTVKSGRYTAKILEYDPRITVTSQACPLFVPLVEEGWFDHPVTVSVAEEYLKDITKAKVDTLILGCTHYPLLKGVLGRVVGPRVNLVDSATEVAGAVKDMLVRKGLLRMALKPASHTYLVSDEPELFKRLAVRFLGNGVKDVRRYRDV